MRTLLPLWLTRKLAFTFAATLAHIVMAGENVVVKSTANSRTIPLHDVFEISFQHAGL